MVDEPWADELCVICEKPLGNQTIFVGFDNRRRHIACSGFVSEIYQKLSNAAHGRQSDGDVVFDLVCELECALEALEAVQLDASEYDHNSGWDGYDEDGEPKSVLDPQTWEILGNVIDSLRALLVPKESR